MQKEMHSKLSSIDLELYLMWMDNIEREKGPLSPAVEAHWRATMVILFTLAPTVAEALSC